MTRRSVPRTAVLFLLLLISANADSARTEESAWEVLVQTIPNLVNDDALGSPNVEILNALTLEQLKEYLGGAYASEIVLVNGQTLETFLAGRSPLAAFDLPWCTIDGGGGLFSVGNPFEMAGTAGQPDAVTGSGGDYTLRGGFWAFSGQRGLIFSDGFESGDLSWWSSSAGAISASSNAQ
ncbi:MAG: hypothetical protein GY835_10245 [bacterium]|nr:hypothetical protein [bacterium]